MATSAGVPQTSQVHKDVPQTYIAHTHTDKEHKTTPVADKVRWDYGRFIVIFSSALSLYVQ